MPHSPHAFVCLLGNGSIWDFHSDTPESAPVLQRSSIASSTHSVGLTVSVEEECGTRRRELFFQAISAAFAFPAVTAVALAAESDLPEDFRVYSDEVNKFKITIPQDWQVGTGEGDGVRSLTAFYPPEASSSNVSIAITGLGADFTRLESFGKVDAFAENLIGGLDRSWQRPPGVAAKLIDSKAANGLYYIEYTLKNPGESRRHLFSVLGIANNGFYNRLYTLTGQASFAKTIS
ncbi:hypothetical protein DH2020_049438 [Rehmannia glutinosa]|uniref:PsbP C-terminal domain-containing protein n=1 Tax=Rehmannia glutinosa TaxID=99300 RepID=A0ABR0U2U7_REHGL